MSLVDGAFHLNSCATLLCVCIVHCFACLDHINVRVSYDRYRLSSFSDSMREGNVLSLEHTFTFDTLDWFFLAWRLHLEVILDPMDKCSSYLVHILSSLF